MLFSSLTFIYIFLPIVLFCYYVLFKKNRNLQNVFLLIVSLFFYAWGEPKFVLIMIASIAFNWAMGLLVDKHRGNHTISRSIIVICVVVNLANLFIFKYLGFTGSVIGSIFDIDLSFLKLALPIGISFFTFQAMSYVIDVYRGNGIVQKNVLNVGLYISFFPQLIAGPIVRYETVAEEIQNRRETLDDFLDGFTRFIVGLAKKVLLSNSFAILADKAFDAVGIQENVSVAFCWLGAIAYTMQIFFDFGGYSDMAIGLGKMFGFHFLENFDYPYISTSISEFWRRWHMSLGTWFRDYVYFPLGGSRVSRPRLIFNLFVVWFLTGVWHGANFTFAVWGLMYFFLIAVEKLTGFDKKKGEFITPIKWIYTMFFVIIGWVVFRADSLGTAIVYIKNMVGINGNPFFDGVFTGYFMQNILLIVIGIVLCTPVFRLLKKRFKNNVVFDVVRVLIVIGLFVLSVSSLVSSSYNPFIYFNF